MNPGTTVTITVNGTIIPGKVIRQSGVFRNFYWIAWPSGTSMVKRSDVTIYSEA